MSDDYKVTFHEDEYGVFAHVCSVEKPCGDVLACKYCRYR
jgi:hypothetical protein